MGGLDSNQSSAIMAVGQPPASLPGPLVTELERFLGDCSNNWTFDAFKWVVRLTHEAHFESDDSCSLLLEQRE